MKFEELNTYIQAVYDNEEDFKRAFKLKERIIYISFSSTDAVVELHLHNTENNRKFIPIEDFLEWAEKYVR